MNDLQALFSVVFGIYFAATVSAVGRFYPFDTTAAAAGDLRALSRCLIALVFLDLLPFFYFLGVLTILAGNQTPLKAAWIPGIGVLFVGLGGFGIYRILVAILVLKRTGSSERYLFYSEPTEVKTELAKGHAERHRPHNSAPNEPRYTLIGGTTWLVMCFVIFWLTN